MWTHFWDMHSGGGAKEKPYDHIFIEAGESEAVVIFYNRFGHNPHRVTCTCCGSDYSISSKESFAQITGFHRNCRNLVTPRNPVTKLYNNSDPVILAHLYLEDGEDAPDGYEIDSFRLKPSKYQTVDEFLGQNDVLAVYDHEIRDDERVGEVPEQGYVWQD